MENIYLEFKKLIIVGINKTYECSFKPGLNIIWGDMDSGKSSILNLIDFSLGGDFNKLQLDYDELRNKGRLVQLEVDFNGNVFTLERVLSHDANIIKAYPSSHEMISSTYPLLCSASSDRIEPDGWISDLILDQLGIPKVKIKESKYKEDSGADRLSFRDLIKLIYLKQKKVASDSLMDASNPFVHNKNVEIQKFVYGVHDEQLSSLNNLLQKEALDLRSLEIRTENIKNFLATTDSMAIDDDVLLELKEEIENVDNEIKQLKSNRNHAQIVSNQINKKINLLEEEKKHLEESIIKKSKELADYSKLKSTYERDLSCLELSAKARQVLNHNEQSEINTNCPVCSSQLTVSHPTINSETIGYETNSIKNRLQGCSTTIKKTIIDIDDKRERIQSIEESLSALRANFDKEHLENLSPTITSLMQAMALKQKLSVNCAMLERNRKTFKIFEEYYSLIDNKKINMSNIRRDISKIEAQLGDIEEIISELSIIFSELIKTSKLTNNYGSKIDRKFMPIFRDRQYDHISSGGVRTILSVYLYLSRLSYVIKNGAYLPATLMLDTPGQNIGRYARKGKDEERDDDNISDPSIYEEIYKKIMDISNVAKDKKYQIIIVDNDLPTCLEKQEYHLVKRFDKSNPIYEKGLINDA
ncbi:hypothetical protein ACFWHB_06330 [Aeromonas mytilicola subsp. aquatica]|uniref:hypothetical protein n=1 Tax=Aeromonas mytilicola TaxID=3377113 RepID=UPI0037C11906